MKNGQVKIFLQRREKSSPFETGIFLKIHLKNHVKKIPLRKVTMAQRGSEGVVRMVLIAYDFFYNPLCPPLLRGMIATFVKGE